MSRGEGHADHFAWRGIYGNYFFIICVDHIILIQSPGKNGIIHADANLRPFVRCFFMYFLKSFVPFDVYIFHCFSFCIKIMKLSQNLLTKHFF